MNLRVVLGALLIAVLLSTVTSSCGGGEERTTGGVAGVAFEKTKRGLESAANSSF